MKNIFLILSIAFVLNSCKKDQQQEVATEPQTAENLVSLTDEQFKNAAIETGDLTDKNISSVLKLNGKIDVPPQNMVSISAPLGGYLKSTKLLAGLHIRKGEILAVLQDNQYIELQQDYLTAKAQFSFDEREYNRQKELNENQAASDKMYEQAKANYQTRLILIKSLEQKLNLIGLNPNKVSPNNISKSISIHSPIDGYVSSVNVNIGKYVNPSEVLFELVNPSDIHLSLTVFDKDIDKLSIGQKLLAFTNSNPEKKYPGEIILISKNLSNDNATEVHCHFEQYDKSLLPGMFMNAEIELAGKKSPALPDDAVVRFENKNYIFVESGNKQFEMSEVQIGNSENGYTEIINSDEFQNRKIVIKGAYTLLMTLKNISDE